MRGPVAAVLVALVASFGLVQATAASAAGISLAQDEGVVNEGDEAENPGGEEEEGQGGQGDPEAETGAGEGETEGAEEEGPPWTYQMARLGLVLLVGMALGLWLLYHRLIVQRQKGAA